MTEIYLYAMRNADNRSDGHFDLAEKDPVGLEKVLSSAHLDGIKRTWC
jgi:hypothetical protein